MVAGAPSGAFILTQRMSSKLEAFPNDAAAAIHPDLKALMWTALETFSTALESNAFFLLSFFLS
jgi:hypothetical protein